MKGVINGIAPWLRTVFLAISFALVVNQFGLALSVVNGTSMEPTLEDGDRLLINKFHFMVNEPQRGDVVTFKDPTRNGRYLVKRVVGVPGDRIEIRDHTLIRNGKKEHEPYINTEIEDGDYGPIVVKEGHVFVMGDNRQQYASRDSRYKSVGQVPNRLIEGKVEFILWRPSLAAFL
ncbi:signal peptidase I [Desmospora activa]|uniref:Signal peptidase I n=1 Tax=Desmospora activa DSM 45169 TaxID=1121389 RepID=A0A2T4Z3I6_9BACL|nr:signal peptidase I [Desmospora activa]PTM56447.1 signal peptidase I [Desmospora activa DSM 45169]